VPLPSSVNREGPDQSAQVDGRGTEVVFAYCMSAVVLTRVAWSPPIRIRSRKHAVLCGLPYSLASLIMGWWGLPWGALLTPRAVWTNCTGGVEAPRSSGSNE